MGSLGLFFLFFSILLIPFDATLWPIRTAVTTAPIFSWEIFTSLQHVECGCGGEAWLVCKQPPKPISNVFCIHISFRQWTNALLKRTASIFSTRPRTILCFLMRDPIQSLHLPLCCTRLFCLYKNTFHVFCIGKIRTWCIEMIKVMDIKSFKTLYRLTAANKHDQEDKKTHVRSLSSQICASPRSKNHILTHVSRNSA